MRRKADAGAFGVELEVVLDFLSRISEVAVECTKALQQPAGNVDFAPAPSTYR